MGPNIDSPIRKLLATPWFPNQYTNEMPLNIDGVNKGITATILKNHLNGI